MLKRLPVPQTCEDCENTAYWSWELQPICYSHLRGMAEMNSDNESAVYDALISPVLLPAASDVVHAMIIHKSTSPMAICQMLNTFPLKEEISIDLVVQWDEGSKLVSGGKGYYYLDETTIRCNAPTLSAVVEETDRMVGFAEYLNKYSMKIRQCVKIEFQEEQAANG